MIIQDLHYNLKNTGNFATLAGIADTHFLCPNDPDDPGAFQPLDEKAWIYLRESFQEMKADKYYGKLITYTAGDLTELERSSVRKIMRSLRKNDTRAQDTTHKFIINKYILPRLRALIQDTQFVGGVAGNHLIEFCDSYNKDGQRGATNSEEYIIQRLKGKYCGEANMVLNLHIQYFGQKCLKRVVITHGTKGGTKAGILRELRAMYDMYGKVDLLIKAHAHDPMTGFFSKYSIPDRAGGGLKQHDTLVMCLGSTRAGVKEGYDDYVERFCYQPCAARFPVAVAKLVKKTEKGGTMDVIFRPVIL